MKKLTIITAILLAGTIAGAQEKGTVKPPQEEQVNQYGVKVDVDPLLTEAQDGIFVARSPKSNYKLWLDCRVQADGAVFFGEPDYADEIGNDVSIRRARFAVKTQVDKNWYGEIDMDMANGVFELKDAIIRYDGLKNSEIQLGNFKEFFSIQRNNSSRYLQFMERPMIAQALAPSRHLGINYKYANKWLWASTGVFFQTIDNLETRTFVEDTNKDFGRDEGFSSTSKIVLMPGWDKTTWGLHIAGAYSYRTPKNDDEIASTTGANAVRFSTRNSNSINRKKYIDTGEIENVNFQNLYTAELAGYWGGFRGEAVYMATDVHQFDNPTAMHFDGWYVQGGYLLFGGRQRYDANGAKFTRVKRGQKWGDLELCGRYEYINFNDPQLIAGGAQAYALGLNYYITDHVKCMVNYQYNDNDRYANGKGNKLFVGLDEAGKPTKDYTKVVTAAGKAGVDYHMLSVRFEIDF